MGKSSININVDPFAKRRGEELKKRQDLNRTSYVNTALAIAEKTLGKETASEFAELAENIKTNAGANLLVNIMKKGGDLNRVTQAQADEIKRLNPASDVKLKLFGGGEINRKITSASDKATTKLTKYQEQDGVFSPTENIREVPSTSPLPSFDPAEERRLGGEERRLKQARRDSIGQYGTIVKESNKEAFQQETGIDVESAVEGFGIARRVNSETGERSIRIPSQKERDNIIANKVFKPGEIDHMTNILDTRDTLTEVVEGLEELGISDFSDAFDVEFDEGLKSPLGPFSIPARFNLVGQFTKEPKYTALKQKLERAFQQYRKIITGAQASDKELKTLRPLIASFTDRPENFFENINSLIDENDRLFQTRLSTAGAAGRDTARFQELIDQRVGKTAKRRGGSGSETKNITEEDPVAKSFSSLWS